MKRKKAKSQNSKNQLKKEVLAMRKKLGAYGKPLNNLSLEELKIEAAFMQQVMMIESDQGPTIAQKLIDNGIELPEPDSIEEPNISSKLWEVIDAMADIGHYLSKTDHLSDRELYHFLWSDLLNHKSSEMGVGLGVLGETSEVIDTESIDYYRYYGDEFDKEYFSEIHPDEKFPEREALPFDREERLPSMFAKAA